MDPISGKPIRFLSFSDDKEDAEKQAKLQEAAAQIEKAIAKDNALNELIDYIPPTEETVDQTNDTRPLYERLLEQRNKRKDVIEESQKLSNLVTKLDEDDVTYLNNLAQTRKEEELKKRLEVYDALEEKKRLDERRILEEEKSIRDSLLGKSTNRGSSSRSRLSSMIKLKPKQTTSQQAMAAKDKLEDANQDSTQSKTSTKRSLELEGTSDKPKGSPRQNEPEKRQKTDHNDIPPNDQNNQPSTDEVVCSCPKDVMKCIGILPSLPIVDENEDFSNSDNSDDEHHNDRQIIIKTRHQK